MVLLPSPFPSTNRKGREAEQHVLLVTTLLRYPPWIRVRRRLRNVLVLLRSTTCNGMHTLYHLLMCCWVPTFRRFRRGGTQRWPLDPWDDPIPRVQKGGLNASIEAPSHYGNKEERKCALTVPLFAGILYLGCARGKECARSLPSFTPCGQKWSFRRGPKWTIGWTKLLVGSGIPRCQSGGTNPEVPIRRWQSGGGVLDLPSKG